MHPRQELLSSVGRCAICRWLRKALAVTATYLLSEDGRKASLLAGGDGRARQELTVHVPANRLHLVSVDFEGVARLKLRPRYERDGEQRVARIDELPTYDAPPAIDDLFKDAARNHQLERDVRRGTSCREGAPAGRGPRAARRRWRRRSWRIRRNEPSCILRRRRSAAIIGTDTGRLLFDASTDVGAARDVPPEAHRRFRADLRTRRERNLQGRAAQLALHEEKKRVIAEWVAAHGTPEQQARQAAGVLPMGEAIDAMTDHAFGALSNRPAYVHDGVERLQRHVRQRADHADAVITRDDLLVTSANVERMTAAQFALVQEVRALMPEATVTLRSHKLGWKRGPQIAVAPLFGVLVTQRVGPFTLRREYAAPDA